MLGIFRFWSEHNDSAMNSSCSLSRMNLSLSIRANRLFGHSRCGWVRDIVFISSTERGNLRPILAALAASPVLTVGDMPGFCERGGVVNLELLDRRIHLQVNLEAANQARLQLSSKLLSLATIVRARNQ